MIERKITIIGDSGVGKTSIVQCLVFGHVSRQLLAQTIGANFLTKNMGSTRLMIWDTAGQERFRSIVNLYFRGSAGAVCVFDLSSKFSFQNVRKWIQDYRAMLPPDDSMNPVILLGNKCDLPSDKWEVSVSQIESLARELQCDYFLTETLQGTNIEKAFQHLVDQFPNVPELPPVHPPPYTVATSKSSCC